MAETLLEARGLVKGYRLPHKQVTVLCDVSLRLAAGERVAVVGRSGCGKSTLLHVLGALDRPEAGEVGIGGRDVYRLRERQRALLRARDLGFVFQSYHLLPEMDLVENVMLPAWAAGRRGSRTALRRRALELLEQVGLAERASHTPLELSGGEQQRAALARALMNEPPLLLADEPTGNLDRATGAQILDLLFGMTQRAGHALLLVTHSAEVATRCDRTLTLSEGRLS